MDTIHLATSLNIINQSEVAHIIWQAKKVLGFSPLTKENIVQFKNELLQSDQNIKDEDVMKAAVRKFLISEMNIPEQTVTNITINKVFPY